MKMTWHWPKVLDGPLSLLLIVSLASVAVHGQYARVKRINAEIDDGILISIWVDNQAVKFGEDVVIHYKVDNRGTKTIYLVQEDIPSVTAENGTMSVGSPLPIPTHHGGYNYHFNEIEREKNYQGRLVIPGSSYKEGGPWRVEVAIGYVNNITGLNRKPGPTEDPVILRGALNSRLEVVWLSGLRVDTLK
jgi:hypothetical protein